MTRVRRSLLFMPGDNLKMITKATNLPTDSVVMDLEDGVALTQKEKARKVVVEANRTLDFGYRERLIRINPRSTGMMQIDLNETISAQPDGYVIPKVECADDIRDVCSFLTEQEQQHGWETGKIKILALIETAMGVVKLPEIIDGSDRLEALMFGSEDLAGDIGATRTKEGWEIFYARSAVVTAAGAKKIDAIDTVHPNFRDQEGLEENCVLAKQLGYTGKMAIHPNQLEAMNRLFSPTEDEIDYASRLMAAFEENQAAGKGAFAFDGKMVDMPMIRSARKVLALKEAISRSS